MIKPLLAISPVWLNHYWCWKIAIPSNHISGEIMFFIPSFIPPYYHVVMVKFKTAIPIMDHHLLFHLTMVNDGIMVYLVKSLFISAFLRLFYHPFLDGYTATDWAASPWRWRKRATHACPEECEMRSVVVGKCHVYVGWIMLLFCCIWLLAPCSCGFMVRPQPIDGFWWVLLLSLWLPVGW